ncbi:MAG TPA: tyrosine-protein phosphatase [Phycisphaerales bacterium]|nr:tyrosine-protein phosphatase [Phycisphaerales bacterium]
MAGKKPNRGLVALFAALAIAGLGALGYAKLVRPNIVPKNFGVVDAGKLYRSGRLTPSATREVVEANHIKTIVDLGAYDLSPSGERVAEHTASALGVERRVFRLSGDGTGNPNAYVEALRIIADPAKQPVLVHCSAGSERTGACVLLYREIVQGHAPGADLGETYSHGHDPSRNTRMKPYLEQWRAKIAEALRAGTSIDGQPRAEIVSPARE